MNKVVFTITGPTCGGKTTLEKRLVEAGFAKIISHTTRPMREGEVDGKDYHFINPTRFVAMAEAGELVENVEFGGQRYGGSKAEFEKCFAEGKPVVLVCEPVGRKQIEEAAKREGWLLTRVFVDVPAKLQAERFLSRFVDDMVSVTEASEWARARMQDVYASRLAEIMTTERGWQAEAYANELDSSNSAYDAIVEYYDSDNEDGVVDVLTTLGLGYVEYGTEPIRLADMAFQVKAA
jgi:guanylate kinase